MLWTEYPQILWIPLQKRHHASCLLIPDFWGFHLKSIKISRNASQTIFPERLTLAFSCAQADSFSLLFQLVSKNHAL